MSTVVTLIEAPLDATRTATSYIEGVLLFWTLFWISFVRNFKYFL
jgi:hypothetical protein